MTMDFDDPTRLNGTPVIGGDGEKLGNVDAVYYDNATDRAEWVAVRSGLFGTRVALVPLRSSDYAGDALRVPFDRLQLRNAPHHDPGRELSPSDEADLYRYYGIDYALEHATGPTAGDAAVQTVELAPDALRASAERTTGRRVDPAQDRGRLRRGPDQTVERTPTAAVERIRLAREAATEHGDDAGLRERRSI